VSAIVTTAGGVEEDLIKCLAPTYLGSFTRHSGAALRERGVNRIGNLYVPNSNYCAFEDWVIPILDRMLDEQEGTTTPTTNGQSVNGIDDHDEYDGEEEDEYGDDADSGGDGKGDSSGKRRRRVVWTPSKVIHRLGREIADPSSVCYWAARNRIPVFCPALTDGSLGDMLYFHTFRAAPRRLRIDIVSDIRRINSLAVHARRAGIIVLGGGLVKHHIANACLMRNGAEAAVYVNTAHEFDGSDAGARPDEAVSWGKIKADAAARGDAVKVHADASIIFPMLVAATFAAGDASSTSPPSPSPSPSSSQTPHNHEQ
jgi:deoxyhypusine synthase